MKLKNRELITDTMQQIFSNVPTFETDISNLPTSNLNESTPIAQKFQNYQSIILAKISGYDFNKLSESIDDLFENADIDDYDFYGANDYVRDLCVNALDNANRLIQLALPVIPKDNQKNIKSILSNSSHALLKLANVNENAKSKLLNFAFCPMKLREFINPELYEAVGQTKLLEFNNEQGKIQWHYNIDKWLIMNSGNSKAGSCPAYYKIIDFDNSKNTLLEGFWSDLINFIFDDEF